MDGKTLVPESTLYARVLGNRYDPQPTVIDLTRRGARPKTESGPEAVAVTDPKPKSKPLPKTAPKRVVKPVARKRTYQQATQDPGEQDILLRLAKLLGSPGMR